MLQVTFPEIVSVLDGLTSSVSAAESHGCLCGALCTSVHYSMDRWLDEIVPEGAPEDDIGQEALRLLFEDTLAALRGEEMEFEPLLPDDDIPLQTRAHALSQWCQGFLYGFGTGEVIKAEEIPATVNEVLRDFTHIGRANVDFEDGGEEEEQAYTEVIEYLRVGVQLVHDELYDRQSGRLPDATGPN